MEIGRRSICQAYLSHPARAGEVHAARGRAGSYGRPGPAQNPTSGPSFVSPSRWCAAEQNLKPPLSHPLSLAHVLCPLTADFQTNEGRVGPVGPSTAPTRTPDGYVPTGTSTWVLKVPTCLPVLPAFVRNPSLTVFSPKELKESSPSPFGIPSRSDGSYFLHQLQPDKPDKSANRLQIQRVSYQHPKVAFHSCQTASSPSSSPHIGLCLFSSNYGRSINPQRNGHTSLQGGER